MTSLSALEVVSERPWTAIDFLVPSVMTAALRLRTSGLRIRSGTDVVIGASPIDITPKLEVFRLNAHVENSKPPVDRRFGPRRYDDSDELLSVFKGTGHRMFIGARRYRALEWASTTVGAILVEDLLVFRHLSGQQAFVVTDDEQPGSLIIARSWQSLPNPGVEVAYLRAI